MTDIPQSANNNTAQPHYLSLASDVVAAYVANNSLARPDLPALIAAVHSALAGLGRPATPALEKPEPAVPIKKSVTPDYLVSLEDGKKYKSLKRHLSTKYNMTPEQYREKWGLPYDYPMVAPNYAKARSELARSMGLGQKRASKKGARKAAKKSA
jgi:predicted transcriptional regulator